MMDHSELAGQLFVRGYNCAQAVFAAFCDVTGLEYEQALRLAAPFGGGIGRMRETCGAFSGMMLVLGQLKGYLDPDDYDQKANLYIDVQELAKEFSDKCGALSCRDLMHLPEGPSNPHPTPRTPDFYEKRPCKRIIETAAQIMDQYLANKQR